jgi:hypothetical protein
LFDVCDSDRFERIAQGSPAHFTHPLSPVEYQKFIFALRDIRSGARFLDLNSPAMRQRRSPHSHLQFVGCNLTDRHVNQPAALGIIERGRGGQAPDYSPPLVGDRTCGKYCSRETPSRYVATSGAGGYKISAARVQHARRSTTCCRRRPNLTLARFGYSMIETFEINPTLIEIEGG